jgi:hypothetical protein
MTEKTLSGVINAYYYDIYELSTKGENSYLTLSITPKELDKIPFFTYKNTNSIDANTNSIVSNFNFENSFAGNNGELSPGAIEILQLVNPESSYKFFCQETAEYLTNIITDIINKNSKYTIILTLYKNNTLDNTEPNKINYIKIKGDYGDSDNGDENGCCNCFGNCVPYPFCTCC